MEKETETVQSVNLFMGNRPCRLNNIYQTYLYAHKRKNTNVTIVTWIHLRKPRETIRLSSFRKTFNLWDRNI